MAVWGIGAYFTGKNSKDMSKVFYDNNVACLGWAEADAPALYKMLMSIKTGDLIYLKAFAIGQSELRIKAIGIVNDSTIKNYNDLGTGISVKWVKRDLELEPIAITEKIYKNNVFNNALYEEFNPDIIKVIIDNIII